MKKVIFALIALIALGLTSCGDNTCVKEIATIINEAPPAYGDDADFNPDNMFTRPDGNVFANAKIKAIIDDNKGYKLTDEDKEMLNAAIDKFIPEPKLEYVTGAAKHLRKLQIAERKATLEKIKEAKTLGDLL